MGTSFSQKREALSGILAALLEGYHAVIEMQSVFSRNTRAKPANSHLDS